MAGNAEGDEADDWTPSDLDAMVRNYWLLAKRGRPLYVPQIKVGHEPAQRILSATDLPSGGDVAKLERRGVRLFADFDHVPDVVMNWVRSGRYPTVSPEIDLDPDDNLAGAAERAGLEVRGPVLKAVALLGAAAPAVKDILGLRRAVVFSERFRRAREVCVAGQTRYFAETYPMDRQQMIDTLTAAGVDVGLIQAAVPDEQLDAVLGEMVRAWQASQAGGGATTATMAEGDVAFDPNKPAAEMSRDELISYLTAEAGRAAEEVAAMNDDELRAQVEAHKAGGAGGAGAVAPTAFAEQKAGRHPSQVTLKYAEKVPALERRLAEMERKLNARDAASARTERQRRFSEAERLVKEGYLPVHDLECDKAGNPLPHTELYQLVNASETKTLVFSEGGKKVSRSEYENHLARIRAKGKRYYGEKVAQRAAGTPEASPVKRHGDRYFGNRPARNGKAENN